LSAVEERITDEGLSTDGDGDGHFSIGSCSSPADDCNDGNNTVYPGAPELCDGLDNDCDLLTDEGLSTDGDGDGHFSIGSCSSPADDCNDGNNTVYPGAPELCDGLDNDCDDTSPDPCNTPPSEDEVTVTDDTGRVTVTFESVETGGDTTITAAECPENVPPPPGFALLGLSTCTEISTDADVTFPATICITYNPEDVPEGMEQYLKLLHFDGQNITISDCDPPIPVDIEANIVCGCTDNFSTFGIGYPCNNSAGDFNGDGDVDGSDLVHFLINTPDDVNLMSMANHFGLDNGPQCGAP